jgi:hypothetical protein
LDELDGKLLSDGDRVIGRARIHDNNLDVTGVVLLHDAVKQLTNVLFFVIATNDDRNTGCRHNIYRKQIGAEVRRLWTSSTGRKAIMKLLVPLHAPFSFVTSVVEQLAHVFYGCIKLR